ncbi:MAG: phosphatidylcholine synthase [Xanthobacteraceae bacterium]|nr:phosphatidylcholine synthase [Xanthobacteraceae bacterium]
MSMTDPEPLPTASRAARTTAFAVHVFTALGGGIALLALMEAVREHWVATFVLLGLALLIDVVDGPIARRLDVAGRLPEWSGDTLDLVVDFVTYVFVPAYVITASGFLLPLAGSLLGVAIVFSGALYFADKRMKADDNHFRGFPALWNAVAFYLFLLKPGAALSTAIVALLVVLTFVPFRVVHPVRVARLRSLNLAMIVIWAALALDAVLADFEVPWTVTAALCAIAAYVLCSDILIRLVARLATGRAGGTGGVDLP